MSPLCFWPRLRARALLALPARRGPQVRRGLPALPGRRDHKAPPDHRECKALRACPDPRERPARMARGPASTSCSSRAPAASSLNSFRQQPAPQPIRRSSSATCWTRRLTSGFQSWVAARPVRHADSSSRTVPGLSLPTVFPLDGRSHLSWCISRTTLHRILIVVSREGS